MPLLDPKVVSVAEMQAIERAADGAGHSFATMMERAGQEVADAITTLAVTQVQRVLILVGPGNNGGDGLVCARHLHDRGIKVCLYLWRRPADPAHDYQQHLARALSLGIDTALAEEDADRTELTALLERSSMVVDALLGTGANRPIDGELASILTTVQQAVQHHEEMTVVAVDCPSGLNCDTGALDPHAIKADLTVTFGYAKQGHYIFPGPLAIGALRVVDIGIDPSLAANVKTHILTESTVRDWLPRRSVNSHKGTFGKVLLAVGSINYPGAAYLACAAAARVGAGLVTGAVPEPIWALTAGKISEPTWLPLESAQGEDYGTLGTGAVEPLIAALSGYNAFVLGCGLGQNATMTGVVEGILTECALPPTVIDADGLNSLAQLQRWEQILPATTIMTPHPAEMARLCRLDVREVVANRWALARESALSWNAIVLLKGPYTVIADPGGEVAVLPIATPALATAGTGDLLAGTIGGLLAQGVAPFAAACLGAWLHGRAGQICETEIGKAGVLASDVLEQLPHALASVDMGRDSDRGG